MERILTDNSSEKITVKWDGVRFALVRKLGIEEDELHTDVIILNPREMLDLISFAGTLGIEA